MPKVSVIIPCYNSERFLIECLDSVLGQTLRDIEIICVDDGSTDSTLEILYEYEKKDNRIRILTQKNQYAGVARNNGMDIAVGKYLAFFDSDDFFDSVMLEKMYNKCEEVEADICICGAMVYDMATGRIAQNSLRPNIKILPQKDPFSYHDIPDHIFSICNPAPWNKLFKTDFIKKYSLKFQPLKQVNDVFFTRCTLAVAGKITFIDQYLVNYRTGTSTSLTESNKNRALCFYEAHKALKDFLIQQELYETLKKSLMNLCVSGISYELNLKKSKEQWLNTALFFKNKFIPDFTESLCIDKVVYTTMSFLMKSSLADLEKHEPILRQDETTAQAIDGALTFLLDDSIKVKVSVIIPVYNTEFYIEECIRSVLRQTLRDIEIICIDNGSSDNSLQIMRRIAEEDNRLQILTQENQGHSVARNNGLTIAKGEYIHFLDSSDILVWCALEHLYRQAKYYSIDRLFCETVSFCDPVTLYYKYPQFYNKCNYKSSIFRRNITNSVKRTRILKEPLYFRRIHPESKEIKILSILSYKIGRAITFFPRKAATFFRYSKNYGLRYTIKLTFEKIMRG